MAYQNQYRPPQYNSAPADQGFLWNIFQRWVKHDHRFRIWTPVDLTSAAGKSLFLQVTYKYVRNALENFSRGLYSSQKQMSVIFCSCFRRFSIAFQLIVTLDSSRLSFIITPFNTVNVNVTQFLLQRSIWDLSSFECHTVLFLRM